MSYYVIAALGLLSAFFWMRYERTKRKVEEKWAAELHKQLLQAQADLAAQRVRYEALVDDLKTQITALEASFDAHATPESIRARFRELFPLPSEARSVGPGDVPAGSTPAPGEGGAV